MRYWVSLLALEVFAAANAVMVFSLLERSLAGYIAGSMFFAVGVVAVCFSYKKSARFMYLNVAVSAIYFLFFAAPLFLARIITPYGQPVTEVFGIPMGYVHNYSVTAFRFVFLITAAQIYFSWKTGRKEPVDTAVS